ncbi:MAG: NAD(P)H-hydrate dehydratase, partial [Pseudomonadota bacterium]
LYGDADKLPPDARVNYERWTKLGEARRWNDGVIEDVLDERDYELSIDALFGTGLKREMPDDTERFWHGIVPRLVGNRSEERPKHIAIDVPSGLCSDSGANLGAALCDLTVTFHRAKVGHYLVREGGYGGGPGLSGKVAVKDIGLKQPGSHSTAKLLKAPSFFRSKWQNQHKYSHGHAFILTGGPGETGAARLAARGALRIGAGLVTLGVPGAAQMEVAAQVTSIMLKRAGTEVEVASVLEDKRINAVCLGPGLGLSRARGLVETVLGGVEPRPTVLDADALSAFEGKPETLFETLHEACVLTPHGGEFARLFPDIAEKLNAPATKGPAYSKVDATREAAKRAGCVVLFKGPDTVIADPDGRCSINSAQYERSAPWLATAGSGDVLAGFITGLLARGFQPMQAAETAAWLHVECARAFGPGLIAEDLPEALPGVLKDLGV